MSAPSVYQYLQLVVVYIVHLAGGRVTIWISNVSTICISTSTAGGGVHSAIRTVRMLRLLNLGIVNDCRLICSTVPGVHYLEIINGRLKRETFNQLCCEVVQLCNGLKPSLVQGPSIHWMFNRCYFDVGPSSTTLTQQYWLSVPVCWSIHA